jgi:hypothetical protein
MLSTFNYEEMFMSCGFFYEICKGMLAFANLVLSNLLPHMNPDITRIPPPPPPPPTMQELMAQQNEILRQLAQHQPPP